MLIHTQKETLSRSRVQRQPMEPELNPSTTEDQPTRDRFVSSRVRTALIGGALGAIPLFGGGNTLAVTADSSSETLADAGIGILGATANTVGTGLTRAGITIGLGPTLYLGLGLLGVAAAAGAYVSYQACKN